MVYDDKYFIAKKIRLARKKANITQEVLAEQIGVSAKQISRIEMAAYMPSLPTFLKIVKILKLDLSEFGIENSPNENPLKSKFIQIIENLTDAELDFCYKTVETIVQNMSIIKKDKINL